jgi:hypothetical protein
VNPDGTGRWHYRPDSSFLLGPAVSPNNDLIFDAQRLSKSDGR